MENSISKNGRGQDGGPPVFHDGRLGHIRGTDDLVRHPVEIFFLIPAFIGVKFDPQGGGQHGCSQVFGEIPGLLFRLAECVMLAKISIQGPVRGDCAPHRGGDQTPGFATAACCSEP